MKQTPRLLLAAAAALGLAGGASSAVARTANESRQHVAVRNGTTNREIKADAFGGYAAGLLGALMRDGGHSPKDWGMSRACARMVRKNRLHRKGVGHARI